MFISVVLFRSVTLKEAMGRSVVVSSANVASFTLVVSTGASIWSVKDSVMALHVAPESKSAYVGTVACPADTNTGTMGRMATVPPHALASQLAWVHSSRCSKRWCDPPHSHFSPLHSDCK